MPPGSAAVPAPPHPTGQQPEAIRQPLGDLARCEHPHPRGRQLDRQRDPIQPAADLGDRRRVAVGDAEVRVHLPGSHFEQPRRIRHRDRAGRARIWFRHRQRTDVERRLTLDGKRHAAGGQDVQLRARRRQRADQPCAGRYHMLAVVQHDQQPPAMQLLDERVDQRLTGPLADAHGCGNGRSDHGGLAHALQVHPTGPIGEPGGHVPGDLQGQPRLTAPPRLRSASSPGHPRQGRPTSRVHARGR